MRFNNELKIIIQLAKPYKWSLLNLFLCIVVTSFVGMLYPYIFGLLVDEVFYHQNKSFFLQIIAIYALLYIGEQSLHLILNAVWAYLMTRFLFDIRRKVLDKIFSMRAKWFNQAQTGNLLTLINKDTEQFMNLIHWNIFYGFANCLRLVMAIVLIATMNVYLALLMFVVVPLSVYTSIIFGKYVKQRLNAYRSEYGKTISWVFEMMGGLRDIQLLARERNVTRKFVHLFASLIPLKIERNQIELSSNRAITFISLCSDLTLYCVSAYLIIQGSFTVGAFIATIEYFSRANGLLNNLSGANMRFQENRVSINKIFELWKETDEDRGGQQLVISKGTITFNSVSFQYNPDVKVLKELTLSINHNEKLAIVGVSGSGKSTLIQLLLKFYEPTSGTMEIDGVNIHQCSIRSLRRNIGVVMQDTVLFDGTLRSNLLLAKRDASDQELIHSLHQAHLGEFLETLPDGLDTKVGQGGRTFSGGQIQRIAITRIFLKNPKILILDEATSALDSEAETMIQNAWDEVSQNRTTIIIAHRLSSILQADRVAFLHEGSIQAVGRHEQLLAKYAEYAQIYNDLGDRNEQAV